MCAPEEKTNGPLFISSDKLSCQVVSSLKMKYNNSALFKMLSLISFTAYQNMMQTHVFSYT